MDKRELYEQYSLREENVNMFHFDSWQYFYEYLERQNDGIFPDYVIINRDLFENVG